MKKLAGAFCCLLIVFLAASIFQPEAIFSATGVAHKTIQVVSSAGTVLSGNASATTGIAQDTVNIVDSTGHVLDSFIGPPSGAAGGDLGSTYPNPTVVQIEGAAIPTSATVVATNSSKQLIAGSLEFPISAGPITLGNTTTPNAYLTSAVIATYKAFQAGHFTQLSCVNTSLQAGSCTTAPTVNVFDGASNTGTALTCSTTVQTKGVQSTQAETQTFAAGDIIGIYVSTQGATCLAPTFAVTATAVEP